MYKVEKTLLETQEGGFVKRWYITKDFIPVYQINAFIEENSIIKLNTGKTYAYSLVKYLNYLEMIGLDYSKATVENIKNYLLMQMYGVEDDLKIRSLDANITFSTLNGDITAITEFYKYLHNVQIETNMEFQTEKKSKKKSFFYGQIFQYDYSKIVDKHIRNLKPSKQYIKWYTEEEKEAITSHLKTLRDKGMFLIQLEGMRVDEVISIRLSGYNEIDRTVQPSRSKGRADATDEENALRIIALPEKTAKILSDYIITERTSAENESSKFNDYIFINLRKDENQGEPVGYHNYLKILKRAAKSAGLDPKKIRTHSGRSTKANELLEIQATKGNLTDFEIMEILGIKRFETLDHYKKHDNKTIAKAAFEKTNRRGKPS